MSDLSPLPSALLNNRYHVLGLLGEGGFGRTFLVEDRQMPSARRCVVKQLKPVADNPQLHQIVQERFQREAAILEQLGEHHSQIPRLYAYFSEGDLFYLVEEWVEGDTLTQKVYKEGALSEATVRDILLQLLPAIADIHRQQMIHRDIKPDNIILRQRDSKPVLIDFGAVKETMSTIINSQGNSSHSIVVGTPGFMPSEQLAGRPVYASDLYSLGLTAIYLLTRKLPQEFATHPLSGELIWQSDAPAVSPEFAGILNRSIHLHLSQRFPTAEAMLHALTALSMPPTSQAPPTVVTQQPISAPPPTPIPQPMPTMPSYPPVQTQAIAPAHPVSTQTIPAAGSGDWKKAVIIGGLVGVSILGGALLLKGQIGTPDAPKTAQSPTADPATSPSASPTPSQTPASSPSPIASSDPQPSATPSPSAQPAVPALSPVQNANASIVGEAGVKNIRSAPNTAANVVYTAAPGDRVRIIGSRTSEGYPWYNIALPNGDNGWIAGQLVRPDAETAQSPTPTPQPPASTTNAVIVGQSGSKNIRSGPGTNYETQHIAYPGDRVRILDSARDPGGFVWYRVYFPNSGADGWIAAQLIRRD